MALFRFDSRSEPLATHAEFAGRISLNILAALLLVGVALGAGMYGYHATEGMDWLDAFLNAAMLLGGMGPVDAPHTDAGKLFAGSYALFSGFAVLAISGVMLAPVLHRMMHAFHLEDTTED